MCASTPAATSCTFRENTPGFIWMDFGRVGVKMPWDVVNCEVQSLLVLCYLRSSDASYISMIFLTVYGRWNQYICSLWPLIMHDTSLKCAWIKKKKKVPAVCSCPCSITTNIELALRWTIPRVLLGWFWKTRVIPRRGTMIARKFWRITQNTFCQVEILRK